MPLPVVRAALVVAGFVLVSPSLVAQSMSGGPMGKMEMGTKMDTMSMCPMMTAEMRGPKAALEARTSLNLSAAQVTQIEAVKGRIDKAHKAAMDSMEALHRQITQLSSAPQFDSHATRAAFDRMGQLHGAMGFDEFMAQREVAGILTKAQGDSLAAMGRAKMTSEKMKMGAGMC